MSGRSSASASAAETVETVDDGGLPFAGDRRHTGVALVDDGGIGRQASWDEIDQAGTELAEELWARGITGPDRRLVLIGATSRQAVGAVRAALQARTPLVVLAPLGHRRGSAGAAELSRQVAAVAPCVVLCDDAARRAWDDAGLGGKPAARLGGLQAVEVGRTGGRAPAGPHPPVLLQFTSGSTRDPKPVVVTRQNLVTNIGDMAARAGLDGSSDRFMSWLPLYHDMGLTGCLLTAMLHGVDLVLADPAVFVRRPSRWLRLISEARATITCAPQFAYSVIARRQTNLGDVDLSSVRIAINGAEPVDTNGIRSFLALSGAYGFDTRAIACSYGLAEATLAVSLPHPGSGMVTERVDLAVLEDSGEATAVLAAGTTRSLELARLGPPLRHVELRVVDQAGRPLDVGQVGEIQLRGPSISPGYWPLEDSARRPPDRWMTTGDLGYLTGDRDRDGEVVVCGRTKDVIAIGGRKHSPAAIEQVAATVPGVRPGAVAAFGVEGGASGTQSLVVVAEARAATPGLVQQVRRTLHDALGVVARDVVLVRRGSIPKTTSGKVRRAACRALYEGSGLT